MNKHLTLGSLFSGSGTFEMAGMLSGIVPVWKSEIEPFPIAVTEKRLPFVKHLGDIICINGAEIEPVDIITFGSPCTDLSVAGKRQGLNAARSGLFFQAIRIIKEMRCATNGKYPRFAVWENVTGAFSSNGGEDFRCVLEKLCQVKDADLSVPKPENGQRQKKSWVKISLSPTGRSMLNTGAYPREECVSTLSQILMVNVPQKYYLSPKACLGILRRASVRGKKLPEVLELALKKQAQG